MARWRDFVRFTVTGVSLVSLIPEFGSTSTTPHPTPSNRPSFTSLLHDLHNDAKCTTRYRSFASFEVKLGNPSPTCFAMKHVAVCRCMSLHHLHPLIIF
jgi:hypothetical protein